MLADKDETLVGILPLIELKSKTELETPFDWHTISVDFLLKPGHEKEVIQTMTGHIEENYPRWSRLALRRIPESSPVMKLIESWPTTSRVLLEHNGRGSYARMRDDFDSFYSGLSRNFRKNLKKATKHIEGLPSARINVIKGRVITDDDIARFLDLEASGWKGETGSAIEKSNRLTSFYNSLCRRLADDDILELHFLQTDTDLLAAQMGFRIGSKLTVNKIAYNESFSQFSPGNYLFLKTVEGAFNSGDITEVDCLTDMSWHRNWQLPQRDYYNIYIFPRKVSSWLLGVIPLKLKFMLRRTKLARAVKNNLGFIRLNR